MEQPVSRPAFFTRIGFPRPISAPSRIMASAGSGRRGSRVVGGAYFDVLAGTYRIEPVDSNGVILHLTSELRVSTPFNFYSGPWADAIMRSIQRNILVVVRYRAEATNPMAMQ